MKPLIITIDLSLINERIRNEIMSIVIKSRNRYLLEDQLLKIDITTLDLITPVLKKII